MSTVEYYRVIIELNRRSSKAQKAGDAPAKPADSSRIMGIDICIDTVMFITYQPPGAVDREFVSLSLSLSLYIYIYIERERERERDKLPINRPRRLICYEHNSIYTYIYTHNSRRVCGLRGRISGFLSFRASSI